MSGKRSTASIVVRLLLLISLIVSGLIPTTQPAMAVVITTPPGWIFNTIAGPVDTAQAPSLAVDSTGKPHSAYISYQYQIPSLVYSKYNGRRWEEVWVSSGAASYINLALDSEDRPHLTFMRQSGSDNILFHATLAGENWITEAITTENEAGLFNSLALDEGGNPHVAYVDLAPGNIIYAYNKGAGWISTVAADGEGWLYFSNISLALDTQDQPHISFCGGQQTGACDALYYAVFDGRTPLRLDEIAKEADGYGPSLAIDSLNRPHISYYKAGSGLSYRFFDGTAWQIQALTAEFEGTYHDLALDTNDLPHIAYYDLPNGDLNYAVHNGDTWQFLTLSAYGNTGLYPSIALDASGQPHIAFIDHDESAVKYAGKPPLPDLIISDVWASENGEVKAAVQNAGLAAVTGLVQVTFFIDGMGFNPVNNDATLEPGGSLVASMSWSCSDRQDTVNACVYMDPLDEADVNNNCFQVTLLCDRTPPQIIEGPIATKISQNSASIAWKTSELTTSTVFYGDRLTGSASVIVSKPTTEPVVTLTGLAANKTYSFWVESVDAAGLKVTSKRAYFRTHAPGSTPLPGATFQANRVSPGSDRFELSLNFPDTSQIQKVTFLINGRTVGSDYTPVNGQFNIMMDPADIWPDDRNVFYSADEHIIQVQVMSNSGQLTVLPFTLLPDINYRTINAYFLAPQADAIIYIPGNYAPDRVVNIDFFASQLEWSCEWASSAGHDCANYERDVKEVRVFINNAMAGAKAQLNGLYTYRHAWNIKNLPTGNHTIKVMVTDTDDQVTTVIRNVRIQTGTPQILVNRVVMRLGNTFEAALNITNLAPEGVPITLKKVTDAVVGFQPVIGSSDNTTVKNLLGTDKISNHIEIVVNNIVISPGQSVTVKYQMVPILFKDPTSVIPRIGYVADNTNIGTNVVYTQGGISRTVSYNQETLQIFDPAVTGSWSSIQQSISKAFASSDYLIITSPEKMNALSWDLAGISKLMGRLGQLASLKNGIVVYWPENGTKDQLNGLLHDNTVWTNRLHPNFQVRGKGYVLLVGEIEIIPSYTTGTFSVNWSDDTSNDMRVDLSDNPYAHTDGNGAPDLLLGRMVGNNAAELERNVNTSVRMHLGLVKNDLSHIYLGSGIGIGLQEMKSSANTAANYFNSRGMVVSKHHWETDGWLRELDYFYSKDDGFTTGDLDGDGIDELIFASSFYNRITILNGTTGQEMSRFTHVYDPGDSITTGDVDNDGLDEIIHGDCSNFIRVIGIESGQWKVEKSFFLPFRAGDRVAVGRLVDSSPGVEIVVADAYNNRIGIFDQNGTRLLPYIYLLLKGYKFSEYDGLAVGNVDVNAASVDEIVFTDRSRGEIVVMGADGAIRKSFSIVFNSGDQLAVGRVTNDNFDNILIGSWINGVQVYRGFDNLPDMAYRLIRTIYKVIEAYDGLAVRKMPGDINNEIIHVDRSLKKIIRLDAEYPAKNQNDFKYSMYNQDLLWFYAHGSSGGMDPSVEKSVFPLNFGTSAPMIHAFSCLTGDYEDSNDDGIVEAFFNAGAGGYIGSTEVSPMSQNSNMSRKLYSEFWKGSTSFIKALLDFKNHRWNVSEYYDWWRLVVNEYNYYGDPKFELTTASAVQPSSMLAGMASQLSVPTSIVLDLPGLVITTDDGVDIVEIPGGDEYLVKDQPIVPVYTHTISLPAGTSVQDVQLVSRSGVTEYNNLILPLANMHTTSQKQNSARTQTLDPIAEWTPEGPVYYWAINQDYGGDSSLTIFVHPFRYKAAAEYGEYHQHFEFALITHTTDTQISSAVLNAAAYRLGEDLSLQLEIEKDASPADRIVNATIHKQGSDDMVASFPLVYLEQLSGHNSLDLKTSTTGLEAGSYYVHIEILDSDGNRHDWRELPLEMGIAEAAISSLTANKQVFTAGDGLVFTVKTDNNGDVPLDAQLVVNIHAPDEDYLIGWTEELTVFQPSQNRTFQYQWDTEGLTPGAYLISAYLVYDSRTSSVIQLQVQQLVKVHLPIVVR
jgi:hypothetical protein